MSKISVTTIAGLTSGGDANKVKIESGDTLQVDSNATVGGTLGVTGETTLTGGAKVNTIKHTGGTSALTIDSTGRILTPARPMFDVAKSSTQSISSGTPTKVTWDTENYDIGGNFASDKFTAPIAGKYHMNALLTLSTIIAGAGIGLIWYKNGSVFRSGHHQSTEINITFGISSSVIFDLAASDYIEVYVFQGSGSAETVGTANNVGSVNAVGSNYWSGYLIG